VYIHLSGLERWYRRTHLWSIVSHRRIDDHSITTNVEKSSIKGIGECIDEDSIVDLRSMSYEVALQHDRGVDLHES
jgi:hypothetical protein